MSPRLSSTLIRVAGVLLLLTAACVAAFKAPDRSLESLVARWAPPPSQFVELPVLGATQLTHLRDEGPSDDPLPIVLLHGTSDSLHSWDGWARELSKTRRVLRADLPGFGLTGPAASGNYRMQGYTAWLKALLDERGLQRVVLVGNSLGGEVAWMGAAALGPRVAGLVLLDPAGLPFEPEHIPPGFAASRFAPTAWLARFLLPRPLVQSSVEATFGNPARVSAAEVDRFFEITLREGNREALGRRVQALLAERGSAVYTEAWARVKVPTLFIWGERDRLIPPRTAEQYLRTRPADAPPAELKVLPGLGHVPHLEDPAASLAAARPFLDALR